MAAGLMNTVMSLTCIQLKEQNILEKKREAANIEALHHIIRETAKNQTNALYQGLFLSIPYKVDWWGVVMWQFL